MCCATQARTPARSQASASWKETPTSATPPGSPLHNLTKPGRAVPRHNGAPPLQGRSRTAGGRRLVSLRVVFEDGCPQRPGVQAGGDGGAGGIGGPGGDGGGVDAQRDGDGAGGGRAGRFHGRPVAGDWGAVSEGELGRAGQRPV